MKDVAVAPLAISVDTSTNDVLIRAEGEIDMATADALATVIEAVDPADCSCVVLDLADVAFIDSSGLGQLLISRAELSSRGIGLTLRNVRPQAQRLLEVCLCDELFEETEPASTGA